MTMKEIAKKIIASINPGTADIGKIGDGTIKGAINELNKNVDTVNDNLIAFTEGAKLPTKRIGSGQSILDTAKSLDSGIYIFYTQNAPDGFSPPNISFTIINKPAKDYILMYYFSYSEIYYASCNSSTTKINWQTMV